MRSISHPEAETRRNSKPPQHAKPPVCHRCGALAPKRGRMSASVEDDSGKVRKLYLCARCIASISSWHALARHAEESERELERGRFQTRRHDRTSDRREAA
jgi:ribosomal protein L40E